MNEQSNPFTLIAVGGVMLLLGIAIGYLARPLVAEQPPAATEELAAADTPTPAATEELADADTPTPASADSADTPTPASADSTEDAPPPPANSEAADQAVPTPSDAQRAELMDFLVADTRHFKGDPDAPVTILEFSDFRCPFCGRYATETEPRIQEQYIDEGLVRIGYRHAAYQGEQSMWAAEASECAADQDAFWPYYDYLVEKLAIEGDRNFTRERLKSFAEELDLNTEAFNACMESEQYADLVLNETAAAQSIGVRGTPTFLINGEPLVGAQPFSAFQQVIEQAREAEEPWPRRNHH
jgi:protein-disulfide isomerase